MGRDPNPHFVTVKWVDVRAPGRRFRTLTVMQHSQSDVALGNQNGSWANLKAAESLKKRSNTAQNLLFYVEEQKRLYQELPFMALPGMRRQSFQRERSQSNLSLWNSFSNLAQGEEGKALLEQEELFHQPSFTKPLFQSTCVALLSAFQFGYNTGVTGAISETFVFPGHSSFQWSLTVSAFAMGGPVGSLLAGMASTRMGRKPSLLFTSALFILAGVLMATAQQIQILILGRFLVGLAAGMVSVLVPLYLGELAPPHLRGALGTGYQFGVVLGILSADLLAFVCPGPSVDWRYPGWRGMFGFTIVPALLQVGNPFRLTHVVGCPYVLVERKSTLVTDSK